MRLAKRNNLMGLLGLFALALQLTLAVAHRHDHPTLTAMPAAAQTCLGAHKTGSVETGCKPDQGGGHDGLDQDCGLCRMLAAVRYAIGPAPLAIPAPALPASITYLMPSSAHVTANRVARPRARGPPAQLLA